MLLCQPNLVTAVLLLVSLTLIGGEGNDGDARKKTTASAGRDKVRLPEVSGVLATSVRFPSDSRERIVNAGLELLESCHHSAKADEQKWSNALDACHVRIKFPVPRAVVVNGRQKVTVSEMVITFPLCSTGYIVVRSEERFWYFAKFSGSGEKLQESLKGATVVERP